MTNNVNQQEEYQNDTMGWCAEILELQNQNLFPDSGTLGFIGGCAAALGNVMAVYTDGLNKKQQREFREIMFRIATDFHKNPVVTATYNGPTIQ